MKMEIYLDHLLNIVVFVTNIRLILGTTPILKFYAARNWFSPHVS